MHRAIETRRLFVAGQLVEFWEDSDLPFGWAAEDLEDYAERRDWVLLFNAVVLTAPVPAASYEA